MTREWIPRIGLGLMLASLGSGIAMAAPRAEEAIAAVPEPSLEALPAADRELLRDLREEVDAGLESGLPASEVGTLYGELGSAYLLHDFVKPARAAFENARRLDPESVDWTYYSGVLHQREGELEAAETALLQVLERDPEDLPTLVRLGRVRYDASDLAGAEVAFRRALTLDPRLAAALYGLGQIAYAEGRDRDAVEHLEAALDAQPSATSIHHLLGLAHRRLGDLEAAKGHLAANRHDPVEWSDPRIERLTLLLGGARPHVKAGGRAVAVGDLETALRHYRKAVEVDPEDALARYNLALALARTGQTDEALTELREALAIDPDYRDAHYNLATTLAELGRWAEAARHFRRAAEIDPLDAESRLAWGRAEAAAGRPSEARDILLELNAGGASVSRDTRAEALLSLATLEERASRTEEAEARLREALELGSRRAFEALGSLLARRGELQEAAEIYGEASRRWPSAPPLRFGQAMALLLAGEDAEAREVLEAAVTAIPEALELRHLLARVLAASPRDEVRDPDRALEIASEVANRRSTLVHGETVAMALAAAGRFEEAAALQSRLVDAARRQPGIDPGPFEHRLARYRAGEPVTAPWRIE